MTVKSFGLLFVLYSINHKEIGQILSDWTKNLGNSKRPPQVPVYKIWGQSDTRGAQGTPDLGQI